MYYDHEHDLKKVFDHKPGRSEQNKRPPLHKGAILETRGNRGARLLCDFDSVPVWRNGNILDSTLAKRFF